DSGHVRAQQLPGGGTAGKIDTRELAYRAVRTVARHQIGGPQPLTTRRRLDGDLHVVALVGQAYQPPATSQHRAEALRPPLEQCPDRALRSLPQAGIRAGQAQVQVDAAEVT